MAISRLHSNTWGGRLANRNHERATALSFRELEVFARTVDSARLLRVSGHGAIAAVIQGHALRSDS